MSSGSKGLSVHQNLSRLALGPIHPSPVGIGALLEGKVDGAWHLPHTAI